MMKGNHMKLVHISAHLNDEGHVTVSMAAEMGAMSHMDAQAMVVEALGTIDEFTIPASLRREEQQEEAPAEEEKPKRGRGRPKKEEAEAEEKPAPKRGRGRPKKEEPAPEPEAEEAEEITDIQLAKAASAAAKATNKETVTAVLSEFGVTSVNDLEQGDRQTFLDTLEIVTA